MMMVQMDTSSGLHFYSYL